MPSLKGLVDPNNVILQKLITTSLSIIYGILVCYYLLFSLIRNRSNFFRKKNRSSPPECLNDPSIGVEHRFARLKDVKLHYVCGGDPNKQLMLLIHGFPEFWYSWRHQIKEFTKDYFVVAIDQRGYADSEKPNGVENYTTDKMVDDIKQLLEGLNKKDIVLVGHDWGGAICWLFAAQYNHFVRKLIILNAPHPVHFGEVRQTSFKQFMMSWYMLFFNLPLLPEFALQTNDYYCFDFSFRNGSGQPLLSADQLEAYKYTFDKNSFTGPLNYYRASIRNRAVKRLSSYQIKMPTLVIWGKKDHYLSEQLAEPFKFVDNLAVKYIDNCSHWIQMDQPSLVNQYIREFLTEK